MSGQVVCGRCGAPVGWSFPRPEDICLECGKTIAPKWHELVAEALALGYTVELVEYCETADSPGILGSRAGVCIPAKKRILIRESLGEKDRVTVLAHELEHACGAGHEIDGPGTKPILDFEHEALGTLTPERRFRMYMAIHEKLKDVPGAEGVREEAFEQARKAASESPLVQEILTELLDRARGQATD